MKTADIIKENLAPFIADGSITVTVAEPSVFIDGGHWSLHVHENVLAHLTMPIGDDRYDVEDYDGFLNNVFSLEVEQGLSLADRQLGGAISLQLIAVVGLRRPRVAGLNRRLGFRLRQF